MAKTCGYCVYFDANNNYNYCRRNAPTAALSGSTKVVWPQVDPVNDWCAEGYNSTDGTYDPNPPANFAPPVDASPHAKQVQSR